MPPCEYTITIKHSDHNSKTLYRYNLFDVNRLYAIPVLILKSVKAGRIKMRPDFSDLKYVTFEAVSKLTQWAYSKTNI